MGIHLPRETKNHFVENHFGFENHYIIQNPNTVMRSRDECDKRQKKAGVLKIQREASGWKAGAKLRVNEYKVAGLSNPK